MPITEYKWNSVPLNEDLGDYTISPSVHSNNWYTNQLQMSDNRRQQLMKYNEMDQSSVEISRCLDMLAEDVSSANGDNDIFDLFIPDDAKIRKTDIKLYEALKDLWDTRTNMTATLFAKARKVLKFGAMYYHIRTDFTLKELPPERIVGYVHDPNDEDVVTHYLYDPSAQLLIDGNMNNRGNRKSVTGTTTNTTGEKNAGLRAIPVSDMLVLKIGDGPYGKSVLNNVYRAWRQLSLLEDAIVIYRVVRAPERTVYYIDVGNLQGPKRKKAIQEQKQGLSQRRVNRDGNVETELDPHSANENIFIPTNGQGKGSRVETLQGGQNLGELSDLQWFHQKLADGLRIPQSLYGSSAGGQDGVYSDMRVGQVYTAEIRYNSHTRRLSKEIENSLDRLYKKFAKDRDIHIDERVRIEIVPPTSFAKYKEMEISQAQLNVYSMTANLPHMSKREAMKLYLDWDHEKIIANEVEVLKQKGLDDDVIASMPDQDICNIVYGDGNKGSKYGLTPPEPGGIPY